MDSKNQKHPTTIFHCFRKIALAEGISFIVLLLIAMPLKYFGDWPVAVTITGGLHGLLFVAFVIMAFIVKLKFNKDAGWLIKSFIASIVPFGTFWMDHHIWKKESIEILHARHES